MATPCYAEFVLKKGTNQTSSELCSGYSNHNYSNNTVKKKYKFQVSGRGIGIGCGKNRECYNIILVEEWSGKTNKVESNKIYTCNVDLQKG